jgi:hypothetical protein
MVPLSAPFLRFQRLQVRRRFGIQAVFNLRGSSREQSKVLRGQLRRCRASTKGNENEEWKGSKLHKGDIHMRFAAKKADYTSFV